MVGLIVLTNRGDIHISYCTWIFYALLDVCCIFIMLGFGICICICNLNLHSHSNIHCISNYVHDVHLWSAFACMLIDHFLLDTCICACIFVYVFMQYYIQQGLNVYAPNHIVYISLPHLEAMDRACVCIRSKKSTTMCGNCCNQLHWNLFWLHCCED